MYAASLTFSFGTSRTGLTDLRAQPRTAAHAATGAAIATGFTEEGRGVYAWSGNVPDDAVEVKAYSNALPGVVFSIRATLLDARVSSRATPADVAPTINFAPVINPPSVTVTGGYLQADRDAAVAITQAIGGIVTATGSIGGNVDALLAMTAGTGVARKFTTTALMNGTGGTADTLLTAMTEVDADGARRFKVGTFSAVAIDQAGFVGEIVAGVAAAIGTGNGGPPPVPGDVTVDHDTGGADNLALKRSDGSGVDDAAITAYLAAEYDAGIRVPRDASRTGPLGRWRKPMQLAAGTYRFVFDKAGSPSVSKTLPVG